MELHDSTKSVKLFLRRSLAVKSNSILANLSSGIGFCRQRRSRQGPPIAHVILIFADGWDTLRGMITGWSAKVMRPEVTADEH